MRNQGKVLVRVCTDDEASNANPRGFLRPSRPGDRQKIDRACAASDRAATWNTVEVSSPAILYMLGSININPCDAVNVVVRAPVCSAPWAVPAAPASLCISMMSGTWPQMFALAQRRPDVGRFRHRRRRRNRVDRADFTDGVGNACDRLVALESAILSHDCPSFRPATPVAGALGFIDHFDGVARALFVAHGTTGAFVEVELVAFARPSLMMASCGQAP